MATVDYKLIKNFFSKEELNILQHFCYNKLGEGQYKYDDQCFSPCWRNDPLMNSILEIKKNFVEKQCGLELLPTYEYWRYYVFGATLRNHIDRPACEISVSACIKKYDNWEFIIEGESFELEEGDGIIYAGLEQKHKRPGVYKGEGMAQIFLHYINKKGPFLHHAYDKNVNTTGEKISQEDKIIIKKMYMK